MRRIYEPGQEPDGHTTVPDTGGDGTLRDAIRSRTARWITPAVAGFLGGLVAGVLV